MQPGMRLSGLVWKSTNGTGLGHRILLNIIHLNNRYTLKTFANKNKGEGGTGRGEGRATTNQRPKKGQQQTGGKNHDTHERAKPGPKGQKQGRKGAGGGRGPPEARQQETVYKHLLKSLQLVTFIYCGL